MTKEKYASVLPTAFALIGFSAGLVFCRVTGLHIGGIKIPCAAPLSFPGLCQTFLPWYFSAVRSLLFLYLAGFTCFAPVCGFATVLWHGFMLGTGAALLPDGGLSYILCTCCCALFLLLLVNMCRISLLYATLSLPADCSLIRRFSLRETRCYTVQFLLLSGQQLLLQFALFLLPLSGILP